MFEYLKKRRAEKLAAEEAEIAKSRAEAENDLLNMTGKMLTKLCPFTKSYCMGHDCVHYRPGRLVDFTDLDTLRIFADGPKCKLWVK